MVEYETSKLIYLQGDDIILYQLELKHPSFSFIVEFNRGVSRTTSQHTCLDQQINGVLSLRYKYVFFRSSYLNSKIMFMISQVFDFEFINILCFSWLISAWSSPYKRMSSTYTTKTAIFLSETFEKGNECVKACSKDERQFVILRVEQFVLGNHSK